MSTLTVSIFALIGVVVGAVVLLNLWQGRGSRKREEREPMSLSDGRQTPVGNTRSGTQNRAQADDHRRHTGPDHSTWARQRREPTMRIDDGPAARLAPDSFDSFDPAGHSPALTDPGFIMSADDAPPVGIGEDEDLGPPEFETPRLEPAPVEPPPPRSARVAAPTFETARIEPLAGDDTRPAYPHLGDGPAGGAPARRPPSTPPGSGSAGSFEDTRPFRGGPAASRPGASISGSPTVEPGSHVANQPEPADTGEPTDADLVPAAPPDFVPVDVDLVVTLIPRGPINAERLIALTSSLRHVGSKAIRIEIDGGKGRWISLQSGTMVGCLRCSVLLANRQGPLNAVELSDFFASMESLAGQIGAHFTPPDMNQVLRQARELDAVAAKLDTQVDLGVEASEPVTPTRLAAIARKLDLFDRGSGRFACVAEGGELLYTMTAGATTDMIAFVLDVPRTGQAHEPWRSMVACASSCAHLVAGRVVDGAGRGMSVGMIDSVKQQIDRRYRELADAGLKAGEPATLRVFN